VTIAFPRALPSQLKTVGLAFDPLPMLEVTPLRSGGRIALDLGPTLWQASSWQSSPMEEEDFGELRAWYATLTSVKHFLGYDILRQYPVAYKDGWGALTVGGNPFDGTGRLTAVSDGGLTAALALLPVGFIASPGDYFAFWYGTDDAYRALHMVVAGGVADGSGELSIEVRPEIRTGWEDDSSPPARVVDLYRPTARMAIVPGSWSAPIDNRRLGRVSFDAIQVL
jgi:hypothetical protein